LLCKNPILFFQSYLFLFSLFNKGMGAEAPKSLK
jgi:hypothetical protein